MALHLKHHTEHTPLTKKLLNLTALRWTLSTHVESIIQIMLVYLAIDLSHLNIILLVTWKVDGRILTLLQTLHGLTDTTEQEKTNTPQRRTYKLPLPSGIDDSVPLKIRLRRSSAEVADIKSQDMAIVQRVKAIFKEPDINIYGNVTLLVARIKASNAISAKGQFQINCWVQRDEVGSDISSVITDIYTNKNYGGGLDAGDLNLPTTTAEFNGALDQSAPLIDQIKLIAAAGGYTPVLKGSKVELIKDDVNPIRKALFNETNIIKDSLKLDYLFGENTDHDYIQVKYRSPDTFKEEVERYPATGDVPKSIEMRGVTDAAVALARAKYTYKSEKARRKLVTFKTDVQGLIFNVFDRIAVSHTTINLGVSGKIVSVDNDLVGITCGGENGDIGHQTFGCTDKKDCTETTPCITDDGRRACDYRFNCDEMIPCEYTHIIFIDSKGKPSDPLTFHHVSYGYIRVDNIPSWLYVGYNMDNTAYSLVAKNTEVEDYIILSTKNGENTVEISAINYDENIYT